MRHMASLSGTFEQVNSLVCHQIGVLSASSFNRFSLRYAYTLLASCNFWYYILVSSTFLDIGRDLLKWCKRIAGLLLHLSTFGLSLSDSENIYQEVTIHLFLGEVIASPGHDYIYFPLRHISTFDQAVDVFAAFLPMSENRSLLIREIADLWSVPCEGANLYPSNKPTIQVAFLIFFKKWWDILICFTKAVLAFDSSCVADASFRPSSWTSCTPLS